ncbi:MAG: hypothetical protein GKR92_03965 [Gammaproteobacteria bacterium]|nr:MAG: hypothetical protein GKR92_03965 [Gammaproteobacteria bacterium]
MNERIDLDSDIIEELEQGRKIGAIKILRVKRSMPLKEAKQLVEAYFEQNPYLKVERPKGGSGPIILLAIIFLAYALYRILFLSQ